ncbi:GerMN domain-containing protein [Paenibacillaceae bacterium WGS1546]|uniref:GerMN domain-containing protein n=1 Tax=Cohnella sp. WGS1546 TaxID=3366810 RepID=UPI00372D5360
MRPTNDRAGKWKVLALAALLVPALSACGLGKPGGERTAIDPPPAAIEQAMLQEAEGLASSASGEMITVYLLDRNEYLAPMSLRADNAPSSPKSAAEKAIAWMTANKQLADQLPPGFVAVLPEGTKVSSVTENQEEQTISVDFVAPFPSIPASRERKAIEALVWTLTEIPGIDKVKLSVGGKAIRSLPASGMPVDPVLTRGLGINVEKAKDVQPTYAMGVTLYFSSRTSSGEGYFVPVTRLINRQADPVQAALEQLIAGPLQSGVLHSPIDSGVTIERLTQMADTVNVSLQDEERLSDAPVPSEMMEALVLTLTEAAGLPQVQVVMNGDDSFTDSELRAYDRPVTRPAYVNAFAG